MSTILVNTLTGTSTAGSIAVTGEGNSTTTNLQQGLAKAFVRYDANTSLSVNKSFNVSSVTDNSTGFQTPNFTNAFSDAVYIVTVGVNDVDASASFYVLNPHTYATGSIGLDSWKQTSGTTSQIDVNRNHVTVHGDLA